MSERLRIGVICSNCFCFHPSEGVEKDLESLVHGPEGVYIVHLIRECPNCGEDHNDEREVLSR
jgi:hypothetical protein